MVLPATASGHVRKEAFRRKRETPDARRTEVVAPGAESIVCCTSLEAAFASATWCFPKSSALRAGAGATGSEGPWRCSEHPHKQVGDSPSAVPHLHSLVPQQDCCSGLISEAAGGAMAACFSQHQAPALITKVATTMVKIRSMFRRNSMTAVSTFKLFQQRPMIRQL